MSIVGPRPELVDVVAAYDPWQHRRHAVKPGVTGIWQISGDTRLLHECTEMELGYLADLSLANDIRIILKTFPALARRTGF
jgi:lipopolysaccharide/colanic/teichoic acid biosynthesis glycosyltransferase